MYWAPARYQFCGIKLIKQGTSDLPPPQEIVQSDSLTCSRATAQDTKCVTQKYPETQQKNSAESASKACCALHNPSLLDEVSCFCLSASLVCWRTKCSNVQTDIRVVQCKLPLSLIYVFHRDSHATKSFKGLRSIGSGNLPPSNARSTGQSSGLCCCLFKG